MAIVRHTSKSIAAVSVQTRIEAWRKQATFAARNAKTDVERCAAALTLIKELTGLAERLNNADAQTLASVLRACDTAWAAFAVQCGSVIEGYAPTTKWFRQIMAQLAFKHTDYHTLDAQVYEIGWGSAIDLLNPEPTDNQALFQIA